MSYLGVSLGGILGSVFIAVEPSVNAAVLNVAGGRVAFLGDNPGTRPIYQSALAEQAGLPVTDPDFEIFIQRMLSSANRRSTPPTRSTSPAGGAPIRRPGFAPRRVLIQEGIGDDARQQRRARKRSPIAGDLPAQTPQSDVDGVSGLWRFDPPGGHGIFGRADVREQAVGFLASGGTAIVAP